MNDDTELRREVRELVRLASEPFRVDQIEYVLVPSNALAAVRYALDPWLEAETAAPASAAPGNGEG